MVNGIKNNIDKAEIAKFEAQAPVWWDKKGEFKGLHDINPLRLHYIDARSPLSGKRVLDVGCGGGILAEGMAALGADVTGIDMGRAPLAIARHHLGVSGLDVTYRRITAEDLVESDPESFNVVTCMELLEHVPDPSSIVQACHHLVKPGGDVFFATLNRTFKAYLLAIVAAEYILGIVKKGTHTYSKFIKPPELEAWARVVGLSKQDETGLRYNPVLNRKWLGGTMDVNYLMHFKKCL
jgi:2-polyprenyl-6-hydroxyphenyl methylase/3-demethylubiquinone-9 3-methyltransferase